MMKKIKLQTKAKNVKVSKRVSVSKIKPSLLAKGQHR